MGQSYTSELSVSFISSIVSECVLLYFLILPERVLDKTELDESEAVSFHSACFLSMWPGREAFNILFPQTEQDTFTTLTGSLKSLDGSPVDMMDCSDTSAWRDLVTLDELDIEDIEETSI